MVKVRVWVTESGSVGKVDVLESSGWTDLDEVAVKAMQLSTWAPACSAKGSPVGASFKYQARFSMHGL
jgi:TonB family protein